MTRHSIWVTLDPSSCFSPSCPSKYPMNSSTLYSLVTVLPKVTNRLFNFRQFPSANFIIFFTIFMALSLASMLCTLMIILWIFLVIDDVRVFRSCRAALLVDFFSFLIDFWCEGMTVNYKVGAAGLGFCRWEGRLWRLYFSNRRDLSLSWYWIASLRSW